MEIKEIEAVIESLLFAAGDSVPLEKLSEIIELDKKTTKLIISNMISCQSSMRGIMVREINGGYQLCTRPEYGEYVKKLFQPRQKQGLSQAAFETLAIIAYNSPITKAAIEQIRGVNSDSAIGRLIDRNLIREAGKLDSPGKPLLYEITDEFYRSFGFSSAADLPRLEMNELRVQQENGEFE
ncbi:segregation and condensation protein B [Anaerobacterium chartisolvens]|uniref:Segregation and condensation protein B n=1 Tax=Anaerobacterium chartisolvens TaxID=1297424 RepID=A0A369B488_9FIRM|nr:SMC-Scp complex subunit ScpB [Anaerobacterium chartisolvens]RCX16359.1 segregation and condensation protein B [Anaerobacterium chartisolvens]